MKRFLSVILCVITCCLFALSFTACKEDGKKELKVYMPDGAPALAMAKLMKDDNQFDSVCDKEVKYTVVAAENIANVILKKTADVALIPVNAASKLSGDGKNYKTVAIATNGNLFLMGSEEIAGFDGLKGKVVGVIGQGNVPDLNFRYLLNQNSVQYVESNTAVENKVAIRYFAKAEDLIPLLKTNQMSFGLLPEPAATKLVGMNNAFSVQINMQEVWEGGSYPQAVLVMKSNLCKDADFVNAFIGALKENETWILENVADAVNAINQRAEEGLTPSLQATLSVNSIVNCNIKIKTTKEDGVREAITSYLNAIKSVQTNAVGNVEEGFFY